MRRRALLLLALAAGPVSAAGPSGWTDSLEVHAFLSQGYVHTTHNRFMGKSERGSFDFREAGFNASLRLSPHWLFSAQLLSRKAGTMSNGRIDLDYGLVDFTAYSSANWRVGVIAGRFKNPIGLYNDTRDVPFTRPSVFLPQSIYWEKLRDIMISSDGGQLYGEYFHGRHSLSVQLGMGYFSPNENLEWAFLGRDWPGEFENDGLSRVGRIQYEFDSGRLRLALSGFSADMEFVHDQPFPLESGRISSDYWVTSLQYNEENWSFTSEYMREPVTWRNYPPPLKDKSAEAEGYYFQGTWRFSPGWEALLRYDVAYLDRNDRDGTRQSLESGLPRHLYFARTWSLGITWSINDWMMLRGQYDVADGTAFLSNRENRNPWDTSRRWKMFSLLLSLGF